LAKKKLPFNPFAKDAVKKKASQPKPQGRTPPPTSHRKASPIPTKAPVIEPKSPKPAIPKDYLAPSKPKPEDEVPSTKEETIVEDDVTEPNDDEPVIVNDSSIVEPEIADEIPKGPATAQGKTRGVGLSQQTEIKSDEKSKTVKDDNYTSTLLAESKASRTDAVGEKASSNENVITAQKATIEAKGTRKSASEKAFEKRNKMMQKKRKARAAAPPMKRVVKLNRRKYMEFKVDIREILVEEDVDEEHRANLLGSTWAKGERQGIDAAIEFVEEKLEDQIITESTAERIIKVLKGYRKMR
jgi:hypothetical protein